VTARAVFRQIDVTRAMRAAKAAGVDDFKITLAPDGNIVILAGRAARDSATGNSFDDLMGGR